MTNIEFWKKIAKKWSLIPDNQTIDIAKNEGKDIGEKLRNAPGGVTSPNFLLDMMEDDDD